MTEEELNRKVDEIAAKMTNEEKIAFCSGKDFWHTKGFAQYDIPEIMMADGPNGLRKQVGEADALGNERSEEATCFPTAVTAAQTWNRKLLYEEGRAIGEEAKEAKVAVVLGPGVNIKRSPLCGRNFEYYSEDPYVAGELGASFVAGMQNETGVQVSSILHAIRRSTGDFSRILVWMRERFERFICGPLRRWLKRRSLPR